jgi:uncharacterized protein YecE (DUF72 family)
MLRLGMCGFTIGAAEYFTRYRVVEVQQTFYDPPSLMTLERWRLEAPPDFEFTMKAWQLVTHSANSPTYRRLRRPLSEVQRGEVGGFRLNGTTVEAWRVTLAAARTLRATAILLQCPASFTATPTNISEMRRFLTGVERPAGIRLLWEPRGPWPDDVVSGLCDELDLIHAVDPFVRPSLTPHLLYWRLHGNRSHRASYTDAELSQVIEWLPDSSDVPAYVLFNNIPRVGDVRRFLDLLRAGTGGTDPGR